LDWRRSRRCGRGKRASTPFSLPLIRDVTCWGGRTQAARLASPGSGACTLLDAAHDQITGRRPAAARVHRDGCEASVRRRAMWAPRGWAARQVRARATCWPRRRRRACQCYFMCAHSKMQNSKKCQQT
jgi:hypothetical protein